MIGNVRARVRHMFTYGTLMSCADGDMGTAERALLSAFAQRVGTTTIRGVMFDAGACPGVVLGGAAGDVVHGELWRLPGDMPSLLAALDAYEGCAPHCPLPYAYVRRRIRVRNPGGRRVTAWIYVWAKSTDGLMCIADGRWRGPAHARPPAELQRRVVAA